MHRSIEYQQNRGNKTHGKWTTLRDFNVLETELARNVHVAVKALCMEERTVKPKRRNAQSVLWRDTTQLCAVQRKFSEDWKKKRMSYWVSSQWSIPERERNRGEQPRSTLWNSQDPWHAKILVNGKLVFWLNLIHIQQVALTIFYLPSSWLMFDCCLIVVVSMVWDLASLMFFSYSSRSLKWLSTGASFVVATSCFKYMGYNTCLHFMITVLNLKLCFATDVLTERSGSLSEPGSIFSILI